MHPTIPLQLAEAHIADLHRAAQQHREARTARQASPRDRDPEPAHLPRTLLSQLTSRKPEYLLVQAGTPARAWNGPGIDDHLMQLTLEEK